MSAGPHQLIRDGATLTTCIDDILQNLGPLPDEVYHAYEIKTPNDESLSPEPGNDIEPAESPKPKSVTLTDSQNNLLEHFDAEELSVDQLIERTGLPASRILSDLTLLSLKGLVKRLDGQTYKRVK